MEFGLVVCLGIPALLVLALMIYGCVIGARAFRAAQQVQGEHAQALRYLALNLWEPVVGAPLVLVTLMIAGRSSGPLNFFVALLICWPMLVLLVPARGYFLSSPIYRDAARGILWRGVARLVINASCFALASVANGSSLLNMLAIIGMLVLPLASTGVLWSTITWVRDQVDGRLAPPLPLVIPLATTPVVTVARPTAAPLAAIPAHALLTPHNAAPCPHCRELVISDAQVCGQCGLVFASRIPPELRVTPRYTVLRPLGEGGMGHIFLARDRAIGDRCVIKVASSDEARQCLEREAHILRDLQHPGIVPLVGWYPEHDLPFAALSYVVGRSFEDLLADGPLPAGLVMRYALQLSETIGYLASQPQPIVHCDIKPGNLFLTSEGQVVLLDFGSAIEQGSAEQERDRYGTPGYAAPEQYRSSPSPRSDVYGLAATCYHLATGDDPSAHPLSFPALGKMPVELADLIGRALSHDPERRPGPHELRVALVELLAGEAPRMRAAA